ncbi:MJ1255/VC2487 family glycosyltransferase [Eionea flava]
MKILYGVQGTGNGHLSRARAMNKALKQYKNINVDYLFSGRQREHYFDMAPFGDFTCHSGLTFITHGGKISPIATLRENKLRQLFQDIKQTNLSRYDLVISDFEPISAWAARRQNIPSLAIGHQYAFLHDIPKKGNNLLTDAVMKFFAPTERQIGLHWHHFNQPILPPIIDIDHQPTLTIDNKIVVYLGFESTKSVIDLLSSFNQYEFFIYGPNIQQKKSQGHLHLHPVDRDGFKRDLLSCNGVITNAGFELASEAISLGKKILVKPLHGQMEQLSNAYALEKLSLGMTMPHLDKQVVDAWLTDFLGKKVVYPDVPKALAEWINSGMQESNDALANKLWQATHSPDIPLFAN